MDEHNVTVSIMAAILVGKEKPTDKKLERAAKAAEKLYALIRTHKFVPPPLASSN
ncbi:MAG TPA: hypothetical protein VGH37_07570 [Candidatus Acidoferrum sp.]|jgi:hypothetical protein